MLTESKDRGWRIAHGRDPTPSDLVVPGRGDDRVWRSHQADDAFRDDLIELGMRHRRGHDLRRTFITLAQVDGARRELLKVMTHGPATGDIVSMYTSFPWPVLCAEIRKLELE